MVTIYAGCGEGTGMKDYTSISIHTIRRGDLFWECEGGQDALFIATSNARRDRGGIAVEAREIPGGKPQHFFESDRGAAYGPRLYRHPEYTRPDWPALLNGLAAVMQEEAAETAAQVKAREEGLSLAATQYSESRDHWQSEARKAQAEVDRLNRLIEDMRDIARQNLNGVTMGQRLLALRPATREEIDHV